MASEGAEKIGFGGEIPSTCGAETYRPKEGAEKVRLEWRKTRG
jgi:hypothetical protein